MAKTLKIILIVLILISSLGIANAVLISDQGTTVKNATGSLLSTGNLTIEIFDNETAGAVVFNQTYANAILNGSWNLIIDASLEYGNRYWKNYKINTEDVNFDGDDRLEFQSPLGLINNVSFINFSLINTCATGSSIRVIYANGTVICQTDGATNTSYYLATNPLGFYNLTNFDINNYLLKSAWNATNTSYLTSTNLSGYLLISNWNATNLSYATASNLSAYALLTVLNNGTYGNTNLVNWADVNNGTIVDVNKVSWANVGNGTLATANSIWTTLSNGTLVLYTTLNNGSYFNTDTFVANYSTFLNKVNWADVNNGTIVDVNKVSWANVGNGTLATANSIWTTLSNGTLVLYTTLNNGSYFNTDTFVANYSTFLNKVNWADVNNGTIVDVNKVSWANVGNGTLATANSIWTTLSNGTLVLYTTLNNGSYFNTDTFVANYSTFLNKVNWADVNNGTIVDVNKVSWANVGNGTLATANSIWTTLSNGTLVLYTTLNNGSYFNTDTFVANYSTFLNKVNWADVNNGTIFPTHKVSWSDVFNGTLLTANSNIGNWTLDKPNWVAWSQTGNGTLATTNSIWTTLSNGTLVLYSTLNNGTYPTWNTITNGTFILTSSEANLNVNKSDFWDSYGSQNSSQFENHAGNLLGINMTWLTAWVDLLWARISYVDAQNTSQTNDYTNQNTSQTNHINTKLSLSGGTMIGNINISTFNITTQNNLNLTSNSTCIKLYGATSVMEVC